MIWFLYYAVVVIATAGVHIASWWNPKARAFVKGRKHWQQKLKSLPPKTSTRIWFHVSSLGEFEQARPVIEKLKSEGHNDIILTFFSPSGYEIRKDYSHTTVLYLPLDIGGTAKRWVALVKPDLAVFVKYDFWPGYLKALQLNAIPFIVIAALFNPDRRFSAWSLPPTIG